MTWTSSVRIGAVVLALAVRLWTASQLPIDCDEPVYQKVALDYAAALRVRDWRSVVAYPGNREHPPLAKLSCAAVILPLGREVSEANALIACRILAAAFGALTVLLWTLVDPLAGVLLAVHTVAVKYTSLAYLEALPLFASSAAVVALCRSRARGGATDRWFWMSALALGAMAAGKLTYLPIVAVIVYLAICEKQVCWRDVTLYFILVAGAFWLLDPMLWTDPWSWLIDTAAFHVHYSHGSYAQGAMLPWYQPVIWLSGRGSWPVDVPLYPEIDGIILLMGVLGVGAEWKERRWVVVWLAVGLTVMFLWPTKWPHYTLIVIPPLCLAAARAMTGVFRRVRAACLPPR